MQPNRPAPLRKDAVYDPFTAPDFMLENDMNRQQCFLNSVLQVFWHVKVLKESLQKASGAIGNQTGPEIEIVKALQVSFCRFCN